MGNIRKAVCFEDYQPGGDYPTGMKKGVSYTFELPENTDEGIPVSGYFFDIDMNHEEQTRTLTLDVCKEHLKSGTNGQ